MEYINVSCKELRKIMSNEGSKFNSYTSKEMETYIRNNYMCTEYTVKQLAKEFAFGGILYFGRSQVVGGNMLEDFYSLSEMKTINAGLYLILKKVGLGNNKELEALITKTEAYIDEMKEKEEK